MSSSEVLRVASLAALISVPLSIPAISPALSDAYDDYYDPEYRQWDLGLGATAGTLGLGVEVSTKINDMLVLRATGTGLAWDYDGSFSDTSYAWDMDVVSLGVTADLHPFGNGFRVSAGFRYLYVDFSGEAAHSATYNIGGDTYLQADIGDLNASKNINTVAPYVGLGFDSTHYGTALSFGVDIGALYIGDEGTRLTTLRSAPGLAESLAREARDGDAEDWYKKIYPVVMFSMKYRF